MLNTYNMDIFSYSNFRIYLRENIKKMPKSGHGQNKILAQAAGVSTAFFSQVLSDKRQLSAEQASLISEFLGLNEIESEYFLALVQLDNAGNEALRKMLSSQINRIKKSAAVISKRLSVSNEVSDTDKPLYYSDWVFIAVQQLIAIPHFNSEYKIAERLDIPIKRVKEVISFLIRAGLCLEKNGKIVIGPARIHLAPDSPWIKQHHANWRAQAINRMYSEDQVKLHYSSPMTLSMVDCEKIRKRLVSAIEEVGKIVDPSPSEELVCLNIDLFKIGKF